MANLKFAYPDVFFRAVTAVAAPTAASGYQAQSIVTGPRTERFKVSSSGTSVTWDYDLGAGVTARPDCLVIAAAHLLRKKDSAATAWSVTGDSSSGFATTPEVKSGTFQLTDLKGPRSEDFITTFTYSGAFRYWRFRISTTASFQQEFSKAYLCSLFDIGRDPEYGSEFRRDESDGLTRDMPYTLDLKYRGITDANRLLFNSTLWKVADACPVFAYDAGDYLLDDHRLLHCQIKRCKWQPENLNTNSLDISLRELI